MQLRGCGSGSRTRVGYEQGFLHQRCWWSGPQSPCPCPRGNASRFPSPPTTPTTPLASGFAPAAGGNIRSRACISFAWLGNNEYPGDTSAGENLPCSMSWILLGITEIVGNTWVSIFIMQFSLCVLACALDKFWMCGAVYSGMRSVASPRN